MFVPHSNIDLNIIFEELKISSLDDLFAHIPDELLINNGLDVEDSLSELEATDYFEDIASLNPPSLTCFELDSIPNANHLNPDFNILFNISSSSKVSILA